MVTMTLIGILPKYLLISLQLMIKAVLWSRLAMMRDNIRNIHTQAFVGEGVSG